MSVIAQCIRLTCLSACLQVLSLDSQLVQVVFVCVCVCVHLLKVSCAVSTDVCPSEGTPSVLTAQALLSLTALLQNFQRLYSDGSDGDIITFHIANNPQFLFLTTHPLSEQ